MSEDEPTIDGTNGPEDYDELREEIINDVTMTGYEETKKEDVTASTNVGTPGHPDYYDDPVDTSTPAPTMKDLVTHEVKRLVTISRHYQSKIEEAKTKPKKEYFLKKLRKNNKNLADMIIRLEQLNKTGDTSG